jgi:hypothetical protein
MTKQQAKKHSVISTPEPTPQKHQHQDDEMNEEQNSVVTR